ncbi:MAG: hypothetical protein ACXABG_08650 [Promethearchaeota archaeon]
MEKEKKPKRKIWGIVLFIIGWLIVVSSFVGSVGSAGSGYAMLLIPIFIVSIIIGCFLVIYGLYLFFRKRK